MGTNQLEDANADEWIILWRMNPVLGNGSINTFLLRQILGKHPLLGKAYNNMQQRIRRQQSDNFRFYATRCKYTIYNWRLLKESSAP
jgi:hypothetical protein